MSRVLYIYPSNKGDEEISWELDSVCHKFNSGIKFSDALVFLERKQVVVFHFLASNQNQFVGRVFDYSGNLLCDIPFPNLGRVGPDIYSLYSWSSETDNGVKIVFGTNSVSYRDFWCDFDLNQHKYVATNESR